MSMNTATCRAGGGSRQGRAPSERWLLPVPFNEPLIVLDTGVVVGALRDAPSVKNPGNQYGGPQGCTVGAYEAFRTVS
jgi:hypothetical protein